MPIPTGPGSFLGAGGPVMIILGLLSVAITALMIYCILQFRSFFKVFGSTPEVNHPLTRRWQEIQDRMPQPLAFVVLTAGLQRAIRWLAHLGNISTLTGLLGTVVGVYTAFGALAAAETGRMQIMAAGIHQAIITTIVGLCLAIPSLLAHYYFRDRMRDLETRQTIQSGNVAR
ncbi:MAG: MotA/TolQ/ExbB proton channel family protein [Leptospiraceae bacterium]|nr:MotA/TolQ/ExbB proton channel family protein [Leptospiraceae bacterium]